MFLKEIIPYNKSILGKLYPFGDLSQLKNFLVKIRLFKIVNMQINAYLMSCWFICMFKYVFKIYI